MENNDELKNEETMKKKKEEKHPEAARLNELGEEYCKLKNQENSENDKDRLRNYEEEIFIIIYNIFPKRQDIKLLCREFKKNSEAIISVFWEKRFKNFNSNEGALHKFILDSLKYIIKTRETKKEKGVDIVYHMEELDENGKEKGSKLKENELIEENYVQKKNIERLNMCIIALCIDFRNHLGRKSETAMRRFFSEKITAVVKANNNIEYYLNKEKEIFNSLNEQFIDFYMSKPVEGSFINLQKYPLKKHNEIIDNKKKENENSTGELKFPLPNEVHMKYLLEFEGEKVGKSTISEQRKMFENFIEENLDLSLSKELSQ